MSSWHTRLLGHVLRGKGTPFIPDGSGGWAMAEGHINGVGMCSCGAVSERLPTYRARQLWHRDHKNWIRTKQTIEGDPVVFKS